MTDEITASTSTVVLDSTVPIQPLFRISSTLEQARALEINPVYISLGLKPSDFTGAVGGEMDQIQKRYAQKKSVFDTAIAGSGKYADCKWFFQGDSYIRYFEKPDGNDEVSELQRIDANWPGWPTSFAAGIDAALQGRGTYEGHLWFFKGNQYLRYDLVNNRVVIMPTSISGNWRGVPEPFTSHIDAAIHGVDAYEGICWLFNNGNYLRYNINTDMAEGEPRSIVGNWPNWPAEFSDGIDFAFYGKGQDAEKIYFFRGDKYITYDLPTDRVVSGPRSMVEYWKPLSRFIPQPQLFLIEQYALHTFHGEIGKGDIVKTETLGGKAKTEFYIVTKTSEKITESSSANILESSSDQAIKSFSEAVRKDEANSKQQDTYDYNMDASFHGEAQATSLTGGEVNADLHVRGGSQNVRNSFSKAVNKQLAHSSNNSRETHKQQVSAQDKSYQIDKQTETGYVQTVDNSDNPNPLNFAIFQLTQEYIVVLALIGARLAFRNGDPRQAEDVPIEKVAGLLERCLVQPTARARIAATIVDTLQNVVDFSGTVRKLVVPTQGNEKIYQVDNQLTSTFEVKDSEGNTKRSIVVPGIILNVSRHVVLTPNTAIAVIHGVD